jgi:SAM-dependent methyltransferase
VYTSIINDIHRNHLPDKIKILDIGCGDGPFIRSMLSTGIDAVFTGFDISINMLRNVKKNTDSLRVEVIAADGFKMPLKSEAKFDLIHIDSVLHHLVTKTRAKSLLLVNLFCEELVHYLSENGSLVVEEVYYVSYLIPKLTSSLIFHGLKLLNFLHLDASGIFSELLPGLEVNFLGDKEIERLLANYGRVCLIKKTPWSIPKLYRFLLLKDVGHISYMVTISPKPRKAENQTEPDIDGGASQ